MNITHSTRAVRGLSIALSELVESGVYGNEMDDAQIIVRNLLIKHLEKL